jgi:hypothetical protein
MAVYYYTGAVGGAWSTVGAWTLAGSAGTTGNPGASDIAVLNNNNITIPNTTTGSIINVDKILGAYPLIGTITTTAGVGTLTGVGTAFLSELAIGAYIRHGTTGVVLGIVSSITSNTLAGITSGVATSGITAYAGGGTSATVTLNVTTNSTYTISAPSGIEAGQILVNGPSAFIVAGTGNVSTQVNFQCGSGNIRGGGTSGGSNNAIKLTLTGSTVSISCISVFGGVTANDNYGILNSGAGNTVSITATGEITGTTATAIVQSAATGAITISGGGTIKGGTSVTGFLINVTNSNTQVITVASITPSITTPAIMASNASNVGGLNPSQLNITATTAVNTSGSAANPIAAIQASKYLLTTPTIKVYNVAGSLATYTVPTTGDLYPSAGNVLWSQGVYGPGGTGNTPTLQLPTVGNVLTTQGVYGVGGNGSTPTYVPVAVSDVRKNVNYGAASASQGTCYVPVQGVVLTGNLVDTTGTGQLTIPSAATVFAGVTYGSYGATTGTLDIWSQSVTPYADPTKFGGLINQVNTNLSALQVVTTGVNTNIAGAQAVIGNVQSVTKSTQNVVDLVNTNVASLQTVSTNINTNVNSAQAAIGTVGTNVSSLQSVTGTINTNVSGAQSVLGSVQSTTLSTQGTVVGIQTSTDRIPLNPASVQTTGDQIASLQ